MEIVDEAYEIVTIKSIMPELTGWAINISKLGDYQSRSGPIFYRSDEWILRLEMCMVFNSNRFYRINVYRINTLEELKRILMSNKPSVERFKIEELGFLDDWVYSDESSKQCLEQEVLKYRTPPATEMIKQEIGTWLVDKFISSMDIRAADQRFSFFRLKLCNWEFYKKFTLNGKSLRGTVVFKEGGKMETGTNWNILRREYSGVLGTYKILIRKR